MGLSDSPEQNGVQPDIFAFYSHAIEELLLEEDYFLPLGSNASELNSVDGVGKGSADCGSGNTNSFPSSRSLFDSGIDSELSEFKREKLKSMLRQSVIELTREVDEMVGPVQRMHHLQERLKDERQKLVHSGDLPNGDAMEPQFKKLKTSSSISSISVPGQASPVGAGSCKEATRSKPTESKSSEMAATEKKNSTTIAKNCTCSQSTSTSKSICSACGATCEGQGEHPLVSIRETDKNDMEEDNDWQFLLQNDSSEVDKLVQKYSDELLSNLQYMEQHLEKLLHTAMSKCRPMTRPEKQRLQKLIQKLPSDNLDRVAEIISHNKQSEMMSSDDEIFVDLEKEDNVTLWRLYAYVQAVEKAKELSAKTHVK